MDVLKTLMSIYNEEGFGTYLGGSLSVGAHVFNHNGYWIIGEGRLNNYTPEEKYWWSKCYLKFKTKRHAYYESSKKIVEEFDGQKISKKTGKD